MDEQSLRAFDYGFTMAVSTLVEALGMHWENVARDRNGEAPAYSEKEFSELLNRTGCHHNEVITRWSK